MREYRKIEDGYESKVEPGRMDLLGIGILLTVILIFLVGVLVGKGLWAGRSSPSVAQAEGRPEPAPAPAGPKYTFYDELKQPDSAEMPVQSPAPSPTDAATTQVAASRTERQSDAAGPERPALPAEERTAPLDPQPVARSAAKETSSEPAGRKEAAAPSAEKAAETKAEKSPRPEPVGDLHPKTAGSVAPKKEAPKNQVQTDEEKNQLPKQIAKQKEPPQAEPKAKAPEKAKTVAPEASPKPESKLPAASFTVQIGSYKEKGPAEQQVREMSHKGVTAHVMGVTVQGRTWYRVQVGQFSTRADAESHFKKKLKPQGIQGFVTPR
ncbi:MAG: SPOR domain-containing protein [Deltaproteobacteria bacterium]|nr:SPOR domain-containing protein [Deltaproteobacteria bacterium]